MDEHETRRLAHTWNSSNKITKMLTGRSQWVPNICPETVRWTFTIQEKATWKCSLMSCKPCTPYPAPTSTSSTTRRKWSSMLLICARSSGQILWLHFAIPSCARKRWWITSITSPLGFMGSCWPPVIADSGSMWPRGHTTKGTRLKKLLFAPVSGLQITTSPLSFVSLQQ